uniref:TSA: Wollemia nobilis Ref_Wollemi_Transcript_3809_2248 transcribed RNA sequence n=1 Tax=Wollemia nobilis TaxID=56998 RepID=A0A0C9RYH6_9CONI
MDVEGVSNMDQGFLRKPRGKSAAIGLLFLLSVLFRKSCANVVLIGNNISLSFDDIEANFAPSIKGSGVCGVLQLAEPPDACIRLSNKVVPGHGANLPFALIIRGNCTFEDKVRNAQAAGFRAAIVYNNEDSADLVSMAGNSDGITTYAVFVSNAAGEMLLKYIGAPNMELWIIPSFESTAWSVMAISFVSLLAICAVLATCFFVRRHRLRYTSRPSHIHEFHGMSRRLVKALPSVIFSSVVDDNCTSETCAICLEDYTAGDKLRVLPCHHKFHVPCIDSWLTMWRSFCPVCKRDARTSIGSPPPSENTPLLSPSSLVSAPISLVGASAQSSILVSPTMHIPSNSYRSHASSSFVVSYSGTSRNLSYMSQPVGSCCISHDSNRNSVNIGNASSYMSCQPSHQSMAVEPSLLSRHNSDICSVSPQSFGSRYASSFISGSCSASPQIAGSSSRPPRIPSYCGMPTYGVSMTSFSPFTSAHSLPGYHGVTS